MSLRHTSAPHRWPSWRACLVVCAALVALSALARPARGEDPPRLATLQQTLGALLKDANLGDQVGVSIVDLTSGREVASHQAHKPLNPASNEKLLTAAVALRELGPDFRMRTGLYGRVKGDAVVGGLYLVGHADPTLRASDLLSLAGELAGLGVRRVDEVIVDGSYFDDKVLPPAFEQQPNEIAPFRAAVAAVSVEANAYTIGIRAGASPGDKAHVHLDGPGHFELTNELETTAGGPAKVIAVQRPKEDKLVLRLSGSVPQGSGPISYRRRVESPLHWAGYVLVDALRAHRIAVPERVSVARMKSGSPLLAARSSPPLSQILLALGKHSDNFTAEMLLKILGAERVRKPGRSEDGAKVVIESLGKLGVPTSNLVVVNGSGLFDGNQVSAAQLTKLLAGMYGDTALRAEFLTQLSVGGDDGTLHRRLRQLPSPRIVRAKTGTLASVSSLSGYVLGPHPDQGMAFSVLTNQVGGKVGAARNFADRLVGEIAARLWGSN